MNARLLHRKLSKPITPMLAMIIFFSVSVSATSADPPMLGNAKRISGKWVGHYECFDGKTGVTLILTGHKSGHVEGSFSFYPMSSSADMATGRFVLVGSYYYDGSLILDSGAWIEKPEGHQTISLRGKVNSSFDSFTGTVPECFNAQFNLEKMQHLHYDRTLD
ncbi:hypothetical protein SAMN05216299_11321 [Nitrosospira sp. Nsp14]|uniref:hypothetical protein n=1 Tax=Nitrosospira sp. Nsp14 TaxID=1855333 RepID=UPI0008E62AF4|nr:hypothetical protein [Nitrosospira sp. Nsp14]SFH44090.1 hypothetical protein SAMN05216299_11321 [Nitrosospira sp. Nsp14]